MIFRMQPQHSESRRCGKLGSGFKSSIKEKMATRAYAVTLHSLSIMDGRAMLALSTQQSALRKRTFQPGSAFAGGINTPWDIADEILPIDIQQKLEFDSTYCTVSGLRLPERKRLQAQ